MDGRKLKSITILILALVNLSFAGILISEWAQSRGVEAKEREELAGVLAASGIEISAEAIPAFQTARVCEVTRDYEREQALTAALIGEAEPEEQGGGIVYYENTSGWARFRSSGELEAVIFDKSGLSATTRASTLVASLLDTAGESIAVLDGDLVCVCGGLSVYNCVMTAVAADEGIMLEGRRLTGVPNVNGAESTVSPYTALIAFLSHASEGGSVVKRVDRLELGYLSLYAASAMTLEPVWRIETDGGSVYVSAMDGRIMQP